MIDRVVRRIRQRLYRYAPAVFRPLNAVLARTRKDAKIPGSVLHISFAVHVPHDTTRILREHGVAADYLAVGAKNPNWEQYDYFFERTNPARFLDELRFFWRIVAKYEIIHSHFGVTLSASGWELPVLKAMGRKVVVHYRGCEARDREKNMSLHPQLNICQDCDYQGRICRDAKERIALAQRYGDAFLVTTPDLKDFQPEARHLPFFTPNIDYERYRPVEKRGPFKIVHATNHPGIEGTKHIERAIENLRAKGHAINFVFLKNVPREKVLEECRDADLTIGKMKMGYYANAQIESLYLGVPAVTWVRPDLLTPELESSGLILTDMDHLEETLENYLQNPAALEEKRKRARSSILALHNNEAIANELIRLYRAL